MRKFVFGLLTSAALAGSAQAAATLSITSMVVNPVQGSTVLTGYTGYVITATPAAGEALAGVNISGIRGVTGSLSQRFSKVTDPDSGLTTVTPSPVSTSVSNIDTHLIALANQQAIIPAISGQLVGATFTENNLANNPQIADDGNFDYGIGSSLTGAYSFTYTNNNFASGNGVALPILYIVTNAPATITAQLSVNSGGVVTGSDQIFVIPVPEPTSAALAGLALVGLAKRRRA